MDGTTIRKILIDEHREVTIVKLNQNEAVAIIDAVGKTVERDECTETVSFGAINVAKCERNVASSCKNTNYSYSLYEEAVCLRNQDTCTIMSYIVYIKCSEEYCEEDKLIDTVRCIASRY